ncbi:hypothetical protein PanWU01x14_227000 [Parasponia andersonii]|uniref:Uncharacterized protein n=1 Tax=Parasponia andersonii TaxID=3476 RepID=A0A2P5BM56_PARAD|nr:hypothetical protein PanWU01x14_227000 [Parasponia andersonii]
MTSHCQNHAGERQKPWLRFCSSLAMRHSDSLGAPAMSSTGRRTSPELGRRCCSGQGATCRTKLLWWLGFVKQREMRHRLTETSSVGLWFKDAYVSFGRMREVREGI